MISTWEHVLGTTFSTNIAANKLHNLCDSQIKQLFLNSIIKNYVQQDLIFEIQQKMLQNCYFNYLVFGNIQIFVLAIDVHIICVSEIDLLCS